MTHKISLVAEVFLLRISFSPVDSHVTYYLFSSIRLWFSEEDH